MKINTRTIKTSFCVCSQMKQAVHSCWYEAFLWVDNDSCSQNSKIRITVEHALHQMSYAHYETRFLADRSRHITSF